MKKLILIIFIVIFCFSLIFAIVYGNVVIYYGFPQIPNIILLLFDHLSGESVYDSIYLNAFSYSFFLLSSFFLLTKTLQSNPENQERKE